MTVSVCIPSHKRPAELKFCVESIYENKLRPIQIIISRDDVSEDVSTVLKSIKPPEGIEIQVVQNAGPNGEGFNMANAVQHAKYDYIAFMHDDDFFLPNGIDALVSGFSESSTDAVFGRQIIVDSTGSEDPTLTERTNEAFDRTEGFFGIQESNLRSALRQQFPNNGFAVRHKVFEKIAYPTEDIYGRQVEFSFAVLLANNANGFMLIPDFVSAYRKTEGSKSRGGGGKFVKGGHLCLEYLHTIPTSNEMEAQALSLAKIRRTPAAIEGYILERRRRQALRLLVGNFFQLPRSNVWKVRMLLAITGIKV